MELFLEKYKKLFRFGTENVYFSSLEHFLLKYKKAFFSTSIRLF